MGMHWSNWSGSVQSSPRQINKPGSLDELQQIVQSAAHAGQTIRVAGSGHSFTPLVQTDDLLLSLEQLQGLVSVDHNEGIATVWGGTTLKALGEALFAQGVAQENLGDIDVQSIAGAVSTGTHGTGIKFGTLSTQIAGLTLVTANGDILECSPEQNPEIFKAAQVSLGTLGIIAQIKLRVVPAKRLRYQTHRLQLNDCLFHLEQYKKQNAHFEFFWFPYTNWGQVKFLNETDAPVSKTSLWGDFSKVVLENGVYWLLCASSRLFPALCETVCTITGQAIPTVDEVNYSHRLFSTPRAVRFQEMEYNIPAQHMSTVIIEIQECINTQRFRVNFPIECRFVHADDIWLSPAYQRASAYIAVHMFQGMPYHDYFAQIEDIFKRYQGRPHWGKMHTRTATELATLYPRWDDFQRIRASLDPQGIFLNDYLRTLFNVPTTPTQTQGVSATEIEP